MRRLLFASVLGALAVPAAAQVVPPSSHRVTLAIDSGTVANHATDPALQSTAAPVWSHIVSVPGALWLRLEYQGVLLAGDQHGGRGSYLRLTSLLDNAHQTQHGVHVAQWRNTSAYFNGSAVLVELLAYPGTGDNRITLAEVEVGDPTAGPETICGPTDDRVASNDPRCGRNQPGGCTSWLIDDCTHCLLTAGHCAGSLQVVEFNVPLSSPSGSIQHPPPSDQYAVDPASLQTNGGQGIGDDYAYFGLFVNSTTRLTAAQAQGQFFVLAPTPPPVSGQQIRITGYGSTSSPVSPTLYLAQKTHTGPYYSFSGTTVRYTTDTTGGNSGSPVIDESTGMAIGIHTHGGCDPANNGTGINLPALQAVLANPTGVCECPGLAFAYPSGLPDTVAPAGGTTFRVVVGPDGGNVPVAGTAQLHFDSGSGYVAVPMTAVAPNVYDATFPPVACGSDVRFYVSAQAASGTRYTDPIGAPARHHTALAVVGLTTLIAYDFNAAPPGWTVTDVSVSAGTWARGVPSANNGSRRDPPSDHDGSGSCWVTGNSYNEDVDGGPTILTTETFDLGAAFDPYVSFARWAKNDDGDDAFRVEISATGGATWSLLEQVTGDTPGWEVRRFRIRDHAVDRTRIAFRFSVADEPNDSVTESGVDAFEIFDLQCWASAWREFGVGCAGTAGVPRLSSSELPFAGRTFTTRISNVPPGASVMGSIGFSDTFLFGAPVLPLDLGAIGMPGCALYTDTILPPVSLAPLGGVATWSVLLVDDPSLWGATFYEQGFVLDPGANVFGLTSTNAGEATVGR